MESHDVTCPAGIAQRDAAWLAAQNGVAALNVFIDGTTATAWCDAPQPLATLDAWQAAMAATPAPADAPWRIVGQIDDALVTAMTRLQQIIDQPTLPTGTLTAAQLSDAARAQQAATKALALGMRRLIRLVRSDYDGAS